jgi:hypothetical protein
MREGWVEDLTTPAINWCGAHPGLMLLIASTLLVIGAGAVFYLAVYVPMTVARLKALYPDKTKRPPEVEAKLAACGFLTRLWRWILGRIPWIKEIPPLNGGSGVYLRTGKLPEES